jgi:hypothetical protein
LKTWDFVVRRRKLTLENYLKGVTSLDAALEKFQNDKILPPAEDEIQAVIESNTAPPKRPKSFVNATKGTKPKKRAKNPNKRRKPLSKDDGEFDEIVIINTEEPSKD